MSDSVTHFISAAEQRSADMLIEQLNIYTQQQCKAANSDWPMGEDIWLGALMRCPEPIFDLALDHLRATYPDDKLWASRTSLDNNQIHAFAMVNEAAFDALYGVIAAECPDAITDAQAVCYGFA